MTDRETTAAEQLTPAAPPGRPFLLQDLFRCRPAGGVRASRRRAARAPPFRPGAGRRGAARAHRRARPARHGPGSDEQPPEFQYAGVTFAWAENRPPGTVIGSSATKLTATDADNDPLTYSLEGTDADSFDFDPPTRELKAKSGVTYDFEATKNDLQDDGEGRRRQWRHRHHSG